VPPESTDIQEGSTVADSTSAVEESHALLATMDSDPDLQNFLDGLSDSDNDEDGGGVGERKSDGDGRPKAQVAENEDDKVDKHLDALLGELDAAVSPNRDHTTSEQQTDDAENEREQEDDYEADFDD
jgi:hypothetical protein